MKIPGFVWTIVISLAIFACQNFLPPEYANYGSLGVIVLLGIAKGLNLGTEEVVMTVAQLQAVQKSSGVARGQEVKLPEPRSKMEKFFLG